jgi:hypothetical protein
MGRFIGKKFGLAGYSIEETSLCVLVVISSPPEAGCRDLLSRDHVSTSAVEPFRSGMQSVKWRAGCSEVIVVDWFKVLRGTGTVGEMQTGLIFSLQFLQGRGGRVGDTGAKNLFESVQQY